MPEVEGVLVTLEVEDGVPEVEGVLVTLEVEDGVPEVEGVLELVGVAVADTEGLGVGQAPWNRTYGMAPRSTCGSKDRPCRLCASDVMPGTRI